MVFIVGLIGILVTVILHALTTMYLIQHLKCKGPRIMHRYGDWAVPWMLGRSACLLAFKHAVDIVIWAGAYWLFVESQFASFEEAVYFSSVTYTSLGYGDLVIQGRWRLLCSFEAIGGMILFGLSTALLFVIIERIWLRESQEHEPDA